MKIASPFLMGICVLHALSANLPIRTVFIKGNNVYAANSDGSDVQQLTSDQAPKSLPRWSPEGKLIAFIEGVDESVGLAGLKVVDDKGNEKSRVIIRPKSDIPIEGMRYVEELKWIGADRLLVGGSINPSTVDYAVIDLSTGKEVKTFRCDDFSLAISPDGKHGACWSFVPHFTKYENPNESLSVDGKKVFPIDSEQADVFST